MFSDSFGTPLRRCATILIGGLLLAGPTTACGGGNASPDAGSDGGDGSVSVPPAVVSTAAMPVPAYVQSLDAVNAALKPDFEAVVNARSQDDVKSALGKLSQDATAQASQLPAEPPPDAVAAGQQLSSALTSLASSADSTASDVGYGLCTSGSATAELTRSDGAAALRDAAKALAAVNPSYANTVAAFLPAPIADQSRQLGNGQVLRGSSGPGSLDVSAADADAVITLTAAGSTTPVTSFYVRAGSQATLENIPAETFDIYVLSGVDWDGAAEKFSRDCSFAKTDSTWDFSSSNWQLTLSKQTDGNLTESTLSPDQAPKP